MAPHFLHIRVKGKTECASTTVITTTVTRTTVHWEQPSSTLRRVVSRSQELAPSQPIHTSLSKSEGTASPDLFTQGNQLPSQGAAPATTLSTIRSRSLTSRPQNLPAPTDPIPPPYPLTLFDYRAVTVTAPDITLASSPHATPSTMEGSEFHLPAIPPPAIIALFTCLSIGLLWSFLVILINTLPPPRYHQHKKPPWWKKILSTHSPPQRGKKPLDKPSKYPRGTSRTASHNDTPLSSRPWPSPSTCQTHGRTLRLRKLNPPPAPLHPPWPPQPHPTKTSPPSSPVNPYLPPVLHPRFSAEYIAAHESFFGTTSQYASRATSPVSDLEAQEGEGMRRVDSSRGVSIARVEKGARGWLGGVERVVGRAVERVVRWAGEGEGELLLPVGEGGGDGREVS